MAITTGPRWPLLPLEIFNCEHEWILYCGDMSGRREHRCFLCFELRPGDPNISGDNPEEG